MPLSSRAQRGICFAPVFAQYSSYLFWTPMHHIGRIKESDETEVCYVSFLWS